MPTGYTHPVATGEISDFRTFALRCARAFGALVEMRDEPMDAEIPEQFDPSDYHTKRLAECRKELSRIEGATVQECNQFAAQEHARALVAWEERRAEKRLTRERYEAMLAKVREWKPPTDDHRGLAEYMVKQLEESIDFDCTLCGHKPKLLDGATWKAMQMVWLRDDIRYHTQHERDDKERAAKRSQWVADLRKSLS